MPTKYPLPRLCAPTTQNKTATTPEVKANKSMMPGKLVLLPPLVSQQRQRGQAGRKKKTSMDNTNNTWRGAKPVEGERPSPRFLLAFLTE